MNEIIFIDFESYFDSKSFTLKKMSMLEYIRSPLFVAHGLGVAINGKPEWISGKDIPKWTSTIKWPEVYVAAHNAKFDGAILSRIYECHPKGYIDTLSMARAHFGHTLPSHSLATVAAKYGFTPKGFMATDGLVNLTLHQEEELALYCKHDVALCRAIYLKMMQEGFPENQLNAIDWTIKAFVDPRLVLNPNVLAKAHADEKARRENIFAEIGLPKETFASNAQFPRLLAEKGFECPVKKSPRTGKEIPALALGDPAFLEMLDSENEELASLCQARVAAKSTLLETRAEKFLKLSALGAFPFDVNFSGAKQTHRYSGGSGAGGNPQNLPRNGALREAVEAPAGYKLVVGDFAGIELRIVAWLAMETKLMYAITTGGDVYSEFASKFYGRTITKADKIERQFGKCAILGLGYGMGSKRFIHMVRIQTGIKLSEEDAKRAVDLYRMHYWHVPRLWEALGDRIELLAAKKPFFVPNATFLKAIAGKIYLPSGLSLRYPNLRKVYTEKKMEWVYDSFQNRGKDMTSSRLYGGKLLENISQAVAGEICKVAIDRLQKAGITVSGQVHDELIAVVKDEDVTMARLKMQQAMEAPMSFWPYLRLKAEIGVGQNWKEAK